MAKEKQISTSEMKRYLGVLHEEHLDALKGIKEGFDVIGRRLDRHEKILDSHTEMIGQIMVDVTSIKGDLKHQVDYDDFTRLEKRVGKIEVKLNR